MIIRLIINVIYIKCAHLSLCNYFSFIVLLFTYYVVQFHVRNKDNNNNNKYTAQCIGISRCM